MKLDRNSRVLPCFRKLTAVVLVLFLLRTSGQIELTQQLASFCQSEGCLTCQLNLCVLCKAEFNLEQGRCASIKASAQRNNELVGAILIVTLCIIALSLYCCLINTIAAQQEDIQPSHEATLVLSGPTMLSGTFRESSTTINHSNSVLPITQCGAVMRIDSPITEPTRQLAATRCLSTIRSKGVSGNDRELQQLAQSKEELQAEQTHPCSRFSCTCL